MAATSRRARVMSRSRKLGHCICDPRKCCPCDLFVDKHVCLCAGERLDSGAPSAQPAELTRLVKNAGCASKIPPADLARVLAGLPPVTDPRLLVGSATGDDAGVFQLSPGLCLVQTVDVFTPSVDDPYTFGRIAACNSLSDVYAMGGRPLTALSIIGYPLHSLSEQWMVEMLRGGMDALEEAQVTLVGGHSIDDEEIKFGFAVTGLVRPSEMVTNAGAVPGDALLLTKPLGTGIIAFAAQLQRASSEARSAAEAAMTTLNQAAAEVMVEVGARACTDITGFGLLGHLYQMVRESGVTAEIFWQNLPLLPEVWGYASAGLVPGAAERNREYAPEFVALSDGVPEPIVEILYGPETSGGLLFSVPGERAEEALSRLRAAGCRQAAIVGRITQRSEGRIAVVDQATQRVPGVSSAAPGVEEACCPAHQAAPASAEACCADRPGAPAGTPAAQQAFQQFMAAAFAPGALDAIQKELTTIALSVAVQCEPCLRLHLGKARSMGISPAEIQEAAWMGIAFGGCKAMMFWGEHSRLLGTNRDPEVSKAAGPQAPADR